MDLRAVRKIAELPSYVKKPIYAVLNGVLYTVASLIARPERLQIPSPCGLPMFASQLAWHIAVADKPGDEGRFRIQAVSRALNGLPCIVVTRTIKVGQSIRCWSLWP
jgi:hypothetical protein